MRHDGTSECGLGWCRRDLAVLILVSAGVGAALAARGRARIRFAFDPPVDTRRVQASAERVNPNTASPASLRRLPGIGLAKARAVVAYRDAHGPKPFRSPADLEKVHGIGPGVVARIRADLAMTVTTPRGDP